ncbi:MAG: hypothetical protein A2666_00870 [Parcubacteria group bacterium RIFCSPHIGHO2_01_FULL_47_10b]|nr:MAG: hypothetical protein A2666_00870 [Parcubacteria group bacterium RIFCSPHIGHO2_01_FULL_47_10b]
MNMSIENVRIASTKGNIFAAIHYPEAPTKQLAILCPGYLDSKDYAHLMGLAGVLCDKGYTVVRFDPTGTWDSEGDITDYTTTQYLEDIRNVLGYMLKQGSFESVLLGGHSRGAMVSILYAARDQRISMVVAIMPSSGRWRMRTQEHDKWKNDGFSISTRDLPHNRNKKRTFRVPYAHLVDRNLYDASVDVKKIHSPVILIAGELDDLVLPSEVQKMYDNANEPKKYTMIPGIGHDYRFHDDEIKIVNGVILEQMKQLNVSE